MNLFSKFPLTKYGFIDIFKKLEFSSNIMETDRYTIHEVDENENLMSLSYRYYETVDDWWCIYIFNKFDNYMFSIINETIINDTVNYYKTILYDWDNLDELERFSLKTIVRDYYFEKLNNYKTAIKKANEQLASEQKREDDVFVTELSGYIYDDVIKRSTMTTSIKIPDLDIVYKMKNELNNKSIVWRDQLEAVGDLNE